MLNPLPGLVLLVVGMLLIGCSSMTRTTDVMHDAQEAVAQSTTAIRENCKVIEESTATIRANQSAIAQSTESIDANQKVIQESTATIDGNSRTIARSSETIAKNQELLGDVTASLERLNPGTKTGPPGFVVPLLIVAIVVGYLGFVAVVIASLRMRRSLHRIEGRLK